MTLACLGWGSLIWSPRSLPVRYGWFKDGPMLPVEFARVASDGRVTLVLLEGAPQVRSLWSLMISEDIELARRALGTREGVSDDRVDEGIGVWTPDQRSGGVAVDTIAAWAERMGLDGVVWTDLQPGKPGARGQRHALSADQVIAHLGGLDASARRSAEEYIRRAPAQIDTDTRRRVELELGWTPVTADGHG